MIRFLAACLVATVAMSGLVLCAPQAPVSAGKSGSDCADMPGMGGAATPVPAKAPADCCVVQSDARVPAATRIIANHADPRQVAREACVVMAPPASEPRSNDRDARTLSYYRPPPRSVLLI